MDEHQELNASRRRFLSSATSVIGGIGIACAAWPFVSSWSPSEKTKALGAPVSVDISKLEPGQKLTVSWRGKPIFIVHRTKSSIEQLVAVEKELRDPDSKESIQPKESANAYRSIKQEVLVLEGICTHLGCVPLYKPEVGALDATWHGGFFCPCHGSKYDMAGRVYKGVPAPTNLPVPPYYFAKDTIVVIGEEGPGGAA